MKVENYFAREGKYKLAGTKAQLSGHWADDSEVGPAPDQPGIAVWLSVIMLHIHDNGNPSRYTYPLPPNVTYSDHGRDLIFRIEMVLYTNKLELWSEILKLDQSILLSDFDLELP